MRLKGFIEKIEDVIFPVTVGIFIILLYFQRLEEPEFVVNIGFIGIFALLSIIYFKILEIEKKLKSVKRVKP